MTGAIFISAALGLAVGCWLGLRWRGAASASRAREEAGTPGSAIPGMGPPDSAVLDAVALGLREASERRETARAGVRGATVASRAAGDGRGLTTTVPLHGMSPSDLAARNAAILESSMDGFFVVGDDYRFQEVNAAFCRMLGYARAELMELKLTDLELPDTDGRGNTQISRTGHHLFSSLLRRRDGQPVELEVSVITLRGQRGKTLVGFARDVTERRRAEQALRDREKQYRSLVETSHDLIWSVDLEGRWTFVNAAVRRIYGYEVEEMLGRPFTDFLDPSRTERDMKVFSLVKNGVPHFHYETVHVRKDGTPITLAFNAIPLRDEQGRVVGTTGTATDLTERRHVQERLRQAMERTEALVSRMPLGCAVWTPEGRAQEWNQAAVAIFGYTPDEAIGRALEDLVVWEGNRDEVGAMWRALLGGAPHFQTVMTNRRRDGSTLRCEWIATVLHDEGGQISAIATLLRDVSERERFEAQLRQTQKSESLGLLAGGVAHDFNNFLVGVLCNASLALDELEPDSPTRAHLTKIVNASRRASELTRQMLAYSGRGTFDIRTLDLTRLIEDLGDLLRATIPKTVTLTINNQADLPAIEADPGQIQQVLMNLLINAAEAIGDRPGVVAVSSYSQRLDARQIGVMFPTQSLVPGTYVCLEVSDTGCGMDAETQARIFDPFFSTKFPGRGLGLAAILGIVRSHHGALRVTSEPGVGTVFTVLLPASQRETAPSAAPKPQAELPDGLTALVIDDEEDVREVLALVLRRRGVRVLLADSGPAALDLFRAHRNDVDVVLLDLTMPVMSGEDVLRELREIDPQVRVILSSGYAQDAAIRRLASDSRASFIQKPFTADDLAEKVCAALA